MCVDKCEFNTLCRCMISVTSYVFVAVQEVEKSSEKMDLEKAAWPWRTRKIYSPRNFTKVTAKIILII